MDTFDIYILPIGWVEVANSSTLSGELCGCVESAFLYVSNGAYVIAG